MSDTVKNKCELERKIWRVVLTDKMFPVMSFYQCQILLSKLDKKLLYEAVITSFEIDRCTEQKYIEPDNVLS